MSAPDQEGLFAPGPHMADLLRVFDIVEAVQDPEVVPGLVMDLVYIRLREDGTRLEAEKQAFEALHARNWGALRAAGFGEVIEDDPRRGVLYYGDLPGNFFYELKPHALFTTIAALREGFDIEEFETRQLLYAHAIADYDIVTEQAGAASADFLADLVGMRLTEGRILEPTREISTEELGIIRRIFAVQSPRFRDFVRMNLSAMRTIDPDIADAVSGTPIEDPVLRSTWEAFRRFPTQTGENDS